MQNHDLLDWIWNSDPWWAAPALVLAWFAAVRFVTLLTKRYLQTLSSDENSISL